MYQAIHTKYHGPTNTKGARISATARAGKITVEWDHSLSERGNHREAARALAGTLGWVAPHYGPLAGGCLPDGSYAFVLLDPPAAHYGPVKDESYEFVPLDPPGA